MPLRLVRGDLLKQQADVLVNAANPALRAGGGVCGALFAAAGSAELQAACDALGGCAVGDAVLTPAFRLPARAVIHAVGPIWQGGQHGEAGALRACYTRALTLAAAHRLQSIAFPLLSAGIYGYPPAEALNVAVVAIGDYLLTHDALDVTLTVYNDTVDPALLPRHAALTAYLAQGALPDTGADTHAVDNGSPSAEPEARPRQHRFARSSLRGFHSPRTAAFEALVQACRSERQAEQDRAEQDAAAYPARHVRPGETTPPCPQTEADSVPDPLAAAVPDAAAVRPETLLARIAAAPAYPTEAPERENDAVGGAYPYPLSATPRLPRPVTLAARARTLDEALAQLGDTFSEAVLHLIDRKGYLDVEVYKRANLDRKVFSRLRSDRAYRPSKQTAVALCVALRLTLEETADLLARAGYALSASSKADLIAAYFLEHRLWNIFELNEALFAFGQPCLGA